MFKHIQVKITNEKTKRKGKQKKKKKKRRHLQRIKVSERNPEAKTPRSKCRTNKKNSLEKGSGYLEFTLIYKWKATQPRQRKCKRENGYRVYYERGWRRRRWWVVCAKLIATCPSHWSPSLSTNKTGEGKTERVTCVFCVLYKFLFIEEIVVVCRRH